MTILAWVSDSDHRDSFVKSLNAQRKGGEFCDVLLNISGQSLSAHGCVLSACSLVFRELIFADRPSSPHLIGSPHEIEVIVPELDNGSTILQGSGDGLAAMADLLDYIYTGYITLRHENVDLVFKLAEAFALEGLCAKIKSHLCEGSTKRRRSGKSVTHTNRKSSSTTKRKSESSVENVINNGVAEDATNLSSVCSGRSNRAEPVRKQVFRNGPRVKFDRKVERRFDREYGREKTRASQMRSDADVDVASDTGVDVDVVSDTGVDVDVASDTGVDVDVASDAGDTEETLMEKLDFRIGHLRNAYSNFFYKCFSCDFSSGRMSSEFSRLASL